MEAVSKVLKAKVMGEMSADELLSLHSILWPSRWREWEVASCVVGCLGGLVVLEGQGLLRQMLVMVEQVNAP